MSLAAWTSLQLIYRGDPHERKFFGLDEAQEVTEVSGAGRALMRKLRTDSRKNNNAVFVVTQHARVVLDDANFVGAVFIGRTQSEDAQHAALQLLGKPPGRGYEQLLGSLSARPARGEAALPYREFIYRDGLGGAAAPAGWNASACPWPTTRTCSPPWTPPPGPPTGPPSPTADPCRSSTTSTTRRGRPRRPGAGRVQDEDGAA